MFQIFRNIQSIIELFDFDTNMSYLFNISRVFLAAQKGDVYLIHNIIWQQIMYTKKRRDTTKHYPIKNINIPWIHFSTPFEIFSCFSMLECKSNTLTKRFGGGTNELLFFYQTLQWNQKCLILPRCVLQDLFF